MTPVPELATLRLPSRHYHYPPTPPSHVQESTACAGHVNGTQIEVNFTVHAPPTDALHHRPSLHGPRGARGPLGPLGPAAAAAAAAAHKGGGGGGGGVWASVAVLASPDGRERTLIGANATHLIVNQLNSTLTKDLTPEELANVSYFWDMAFVANRTVLHAPLPKGPTHTIRAFLDGYNLEVFADDRVAITTNLFPTLEQSVCVGVAAGSGGGRIGSLDVYGLVPAPVTGDPA